MASSASQASYAKDYPAAVDSASTGFADGQRDLESTTGKMASYPDELKGPVPGLVELYGKADESGRSRGYVDRAREVDAARAFFEAERDEINRKVAGSVDYTAKQKGCEAGLGGAATYALKEAIDKQARERLREANEAQVALERRRTSLPKEDVAALERQLDDLAYASYLGHVDLPTRRATLERLRGEASDVRSAADDFIEEERRFQAEPGRTDAEKKASDLRIAAMTKSRDRVEEQEKRAEEGLRDAEKKLEALVKRYDDALSQLKERAKTKAGP